LLPQRPEVHTATRTKIDGTEKIFVKKLLNRKLKISTAPTKVKSRESAYSQALNQNKSIGRGQDSDSQAGRQAGRQSDGYGDWMVFRVERVREVSPQ